MKEKVEYCFSGHILFKTVDGNYDYYVCPTFKEHWNEVDEFAYENGIHPRSNFQELSEEEALQFALNLGMTENEFFR